MALHHRGATGRATILRRSALSDHRPEKAEWLSPEERQTLSFTGVERLCGSMMIFLERLNPPVMVIRIHGVQSSGIARESFPFFFTAPLYTKTLCIFS